MKEHHIKQLTANLNLDGFDNEVSIIELKKHLVCFVGCDKYRLKYQVEALIECGYFEILSPSVLKIKGVK